MALLHAGIVHAQVALDAGPQLGALAPRTVSVWARISDAQGTCEGARIRCEVLASAEPARIAASATATAATERDCTVRFDLGGLEPATAYAYRLVDDARGGELGKGTFRTPDDSQPRARLVFGSCADIDDATASTWRAIAAERADALVLIGDTPYIDTTELARQRARYRAFASVDAFEALVASTPLYAVWDDHDIGRNDTDGRLPGKENARRAFLEYRANPTAGDGTDGIYTSFRHGPAEVFVLDTRWFAVTEPSTQDPSKPTLLGERQWKWLEKGLSSSRAPVKVVASSMVWHEIGSATKRDHWGEYPHEFERFARLVGSTKATGVVLVSGDIHRSRVVTHATAALAGYDLTEITTSPLHARSFSSGAISGPHVAFDKDVAKSYLLLECVAEPGRPPSVEARIRTAAGETAFATTLRFAAPARAQ